MSTTDLGDPRLLDAFTNIEGEIDAVASRATSPDEYILSLRKIYDQTTDPALRRKVLDEYVKPAGEAMRQWAHLQETYRTHFGNPQKIVDQAKNVPESLSEDLRGVADELGNFSRFANKFREAYVASPKTPGQDLATGSTALGLWASTLSMDPGKQIEVQSRVGVSPDEVISDALERKLRRSPDLASRVSADPDFRDLLGRFSRASDLYLQMGAQRDQKAAELVATGEAHSYGHAQEILQGWLEDAHKALEGSEAELEKRFGGVATSSLGTTFLPAPRAARGGFLGVLEDGARAFLEFVAPVAGQRASAMAGIMFPRSEPSRHGSLGEVMDLPENVKALLPPGAQQLADMAIIPMNAQTLTEDMAVLLGPIGAQFKVASIPARAAGQALTRAMPGVAGRVLGGALAGAGTMGGAEILSPNIPLDDLEERGERAALMGGIGAVLGGVAGAIPKAKAAPGRTRPVLPETVSAPQPPAQTTTPTLPGRLVEELKAAKPIRAEQEALMSIERGTRSKELDRIAREAGGGEEGLFAQLRFLKGRGELPKAQFESIREKFTAEERKAMIDQIQNSRTLLPFEKVAANKALELKLFAKEGAEVPTNYELDLLGQEFGQDFATEIAKRMGGTPGPIVQAIAGMRSLMATGELSATLRQAAGLGPRFPKEWARSFRTQLNSLRSEKASRKFIESVQERPDFLEMKQSGLAMTSVGRGSPKLTAVEEDMLGANLVEEFLEKKAGKVFPPAKLLGRYIKGTNRAYNDLLTSMRVEVYQTVKNNTLASGQEWTPTRAKAVADTINNFSGRGSLGRFEPAVGALSTALFSPRYQASLIRQLDPRTYMQADPVARKVALSSALASMGSFSALLGMASRLPGVEVEMDPRTSDFGKIKIGKTRVDLGRGFNQIGRVIAQLYTGETKAATSGKITKLGEGYKPRTRFDVVEDFALGKLGPLPSLIVEGLKGEGFDGEPFNLPKEVASRYVPILAGDLVDIAKTDPSLLPWLAPLGYLGAGLQTFPMDPVHDALATAAREGKEDTLSVKNLRKQYNDAKKLKGDERKKAMEAVTEKAERLLITLHTREGE